MNPIDVRITYAAARVNRNLTQKQASYLLEISLSTLINYESGKTIPNWKKHEEMSELYGIPKNMLKPPR